MAEIAEPVDGILTITSRSTLLTTTRVDLDLQDFILQNDPSTLLFNCLGLAVHRAEAHRGTLGHDNAIFDTLGVTNGAKNMTLFSVTAV